MKSSFSTLIDGVNVDFFVGNVAGNSVLSKPACHVEGRVSELVTSTDVAAFHVQVVEDFSVSVLGGAVHWSESRRDTASDGVGEQLVKS